MGRILSGLLAAAFVSFSVSAATRTHPGIALDYHTNKPLEVSGTAYVQVTPQGGDCPVFPANTLLGEAKREPRGVFRFFIDTARPSYGAVFCLNGYYSRVEPGLQNTEDNSPVFPGPLYMFAKKDHDKLGEDVRALLDSVESELRYLRSVDQELFDIAVRRWSESRKKQKFAEALIDLLAPQQK